MGGNASSVIGVEKGTLLNDSCIFSRRGTRRPPLVVAFCACVWCLRLVVAFCVRALVLYLLLTSSMRHPIKRRYSLIRAIP